MDTNNKLSPDAEAVIAKVFSREGGSSSQRPHWVVNWAWSLGDNDGPLFWEVILEVWSSFDLVLHEDFVDLFGRFAASGPHEDLPKKLTIYRGQKDGDEPNGLSWTLNRDVAEKFSKGTRGETAPNPIVFEREVWRSEVAFCCNDREEEEVVLMAIPW